MSTAEFARKVYSMVNNGNRAESTSINFEMAYQAKVATDRIRFAIRQIDIVAGGTEELREANRQLLDALDRLQSAEGRFQESFRGVPNSDTAARGPGEGEISGDRRAQGASA